MRIAHSHACGRRFGRLLALIAMIAGCQQALDHAGEIDLSNIPPSYEAWDVVYIQGAKVGYSHTIEREVERDGQKWLTSEDDAHLVLDRFGERTEARFGSTTWLDAAGRLDHFESEANLGGVPSVTRGRVDGGKLVLETVVGDRRQVQELPWSADIGSFNAVDRSLRLKPMQPGEKRTIRALMPIIHVPGDTELTAAEYEPTTLPDGTQDLLHIDVVTHFPQGESKSVQWMNRAGETLKVRNTAGLATESVRASKDLALTPTQAINFDLGLATTVPLAVAVEEAIELHRPDLRQATYRVTLADGDPAKKFAEDAGQHIESIDEHAAKITVWPVRVGDDTKPLDSVSDVYTQPSSIVESDDPAVMAAAEQAADGETDPWSVAQRIETFVHELIANKNYSQAFSTAATVLKTRQGDCTEHAVLLAALARARGIPSRGALGLVFMHGANGPAMAFHMWTEVFVDGRWIALDGTLGRGGIGVGHLKVANTALEGDAAFAAFLPTLQVMDGLKIELLDVE